MICRLWTDQQLKPLLAFDTETESIVDSWRISRLALAAVSDGVQHFIILPQDVGRFILQHRDCHVVCHNLSFDYFVTARHLRGSDAGRAWFLMADQCRLHCSMTLSRLLDVALYDDMRRRKHDLGAVAERWSGIVLDKSDPYRHRFHELLSHDWSVPIETGFVSYAVADPFATIVAWKAMTARCRQLATQFDIHSDTIRKFGYLGEALISRSNLRPRLWLYDLRGSD